MAGTSFARGLLEKYGWAEGKGLGKNESGIAKALKPRLKFDTAGVGHKIDLTSQWWSKAFNDAARSINVDVSDVSGARGEHASPTSLLLHGSGLLKVCLGRVSLHTSHLSKGVA
ncbi:G patch domain-containing protein 4-like [Dermacentor silvarum]|uniref:G patch domain-containing protein 4-like n=1 Tax=Dermacentor silvarum TaxID=543639 RepID=UPI00210117C5|nr:G patch domain-containing protein 4-like [Dermacentor silvarum]